MARTNEKTEITVEQDNIITALLAAHEGCYLGLKQQTISIDDYDCLFKILLRDLKTAFK